MNYDVVQVTPVAHLKLAVVFRDNTAGDVVISENFCTGVFEKLKDSSVFFQVNCRNGFVEWPGELDLAPDAMHDAIAKNGTWFVE